MIAGVGVALLLWSVIQVLGTSKPPLTVSGDQKTAEPEPEIYRLRRHDAHRARSLYRREQCLSIRREPDYSHHAKHGFPGRGRALIMTGLKILPFLIFGGLLTYLYIAMPNGKVHFKSALLGGMVAGIMYHIVQWIYIRFQIGASRAGAIYGSFAALPLFLIWLQTSWRVVLYGAELAFSHQNEQTFEFEQDCLNASYEIRKLLSLRIVQLCIARFTEGLPPLSAEEIAAELEMPIRLARDLIFRLIAANILTGAQSDTERERRYQPARDIGDMTIQFVIDQMEKTGSKEIPVAHTSELENLRKSLSVFEQTIRNLPENKLLKDLVPVRAS